jgi:hypothetical protein
VYDAAGNRVSSTVGSASSQSSIFDPSGAGIVETYAGSDPTATDASPIVYTRDADGDVVDSTDGTPADTSYYHEDALGSTVALTDSTGAVTDTYAYSAFGEPIGPAQTLLAPACGYLGTIRRHRCRVS